MDALDIKLVNRFIADEFLFFTNGDGKYFSLNLLDKRMNVEEISRDEYLQNKFGENKAAILSKFSFPERLTVTQTENTMLVTAFDIEELYEYDFEGNNIRETKMLNKEAVYSMQYYKGFLWAAYSAISDITCYDLKTETEVYSLKEDEVSYPEHLFKEDNWLYIAEMGNSRISRLNLDTREKEMYKQLEGPFGPFGFYKLGKVEVMIYPGRIEIER